MMRGSNIDSVVAAAAEDLWFSVTFLISIDNCLL